MFHTRNDSYATYSVLELKEAVETYKAKTDSYLQRLEEAEIAKAKAVRAEAFSERYYTSLAVFDHNFLFPARRALADAEKAHAEANTDRQAIEDRLKTAETRLHELEAKLEEEGRENSDMELLRQRLQEEMEDARKQHEEDLRESDFKADQTRKKYQSK